LERGFSWRSVAFRTVQDIQKAGAQGVELVLSGKLAGKGGRKRKQRIAVGYMKKAGHQVNLVSYAKGSAYPKAGAIGVKLRIIGPDVVFPDKINFRELLQKKFEEENPVEEKVETTDIKENVEEKPSEKIEETKEKVEVKKEEKEKKVVKEKKEEVKEKKPAKEIPKDKKAEAEKK
jgi:ribosomal protein S3